MSAFRNQDQIDGFLICLRHQNQTPTEAHSTINGYAEEEIITLKEIEEFYKKSDATQNFKVIQGQHEIVSRIISHCPVKSRLALRVVSKKWREAVDKEKLFIEKLSLEKVGGGMNIKISTSDGFQTFVGSEIIEPFKWRPEGPTQDLPKDGLKNNCIQSVLTWFMNHKKLTIKRLQIESCNHSDDRSDIIWILSHSFPDAVPLKVQELYVQHTAIRQLPNLLSALDRRTINKVEYYGNAFINSAEYAVFNWPCWENVEVFLSNLTFDQETSEDWISRFASFSHAEFRLKASVTATTIMKLKDKLLNNTRLNQIKIRHYMPETEFEQASILLQTFNRAGQEDPAWAYFDYPALRNKTLAVCVTDKYIWYKGPCYQESVPLNERFVESYRYYLRVLGMEYSYLHHFLELFE